MISSSGADSDVILRSCDVSRPDFRKVEGEFVVGLNHVGGSCFPIAIYEL